MLRDRFDSFIFDLDGTLWDSSSPVLAGWQKSIRDHFEGEYVPTAEDLSSVYGMTAEEITEFFRPRFGNRSPEIVGMMLSEEAGHIRILGGAKYYGGLEDTLRELSAYGPLFIVSNCQTEYLEAFLECSGVSGYFTSCICEGMTGMGKGDNIRKIVSEFGLKRPLFVGDTDGDEKSARYAGVPFAYASYGFGKAENPDYVLGSIGEMLC